jgi:putative ABC transport system substrate-binding protein
VRRREVITLLGGVAAWPLGARAQQGDRIRRVGFLSPYPADDPEVRDRIVAFRQGMQERGWSEGRNLKIDYRGAGGDPARIRSYAAELAGEPPDVIIAIASPSVAALRQATKTIPIVFVGIGDPVDQDFVASLARPGGNVTGFTGYEFSIGEKWLGFLKGLAPGVTRVALLFHPELGPFHSHWQNSVEGAAATLGVETTAAPVRATADVGHAISAIAAAPNGGMVVEPDAYTHANRSSSSSPRNTGCQRSMPIAKRLPRAASFPMVPRCATCIVGPRTMSIAFSRAKSPQTCLCKNRSSMSW